MVSRPRPSRTLATAAASLLVCACSDDVPAEDIGAPGCVQALGLSTLSSCVLYDDGGLSCFGWGRCGELGDGESTPPRRRVEPVLGLSGMRKVVGGPWGACGVREDATAWCWGANSTDRFGSAGEDTLTCDERGEFFAEPIHVLDLAGVVDIDLGADHTCAVFDDGTVGCWGANDRGQLGDGTDAEMSSTMVPVDLANVQEIRANYRGNCALLADRTVWCWGFVEGIGASATPTDVGLTDVTRVSTHGNTFYAVRGDGTLWAWGENGFGELGQGTEGGPEGLVQIDSLADVVDVAAGGDHACALLADGTVWCWGSNANAQIARPGDPASSTPIEYEGIPPAAAIYSGQEHLCIVARDGSVHCWGCNCCYQLGNDPKVVCASQGGTGTSAVVAEIPCPGDADARRTSFYGCAAAGGGGRAAIGALLLVVLCRARRRRSTRKG